MAGAAMRQFLQLSCKMDEIDQKKLKRAVRFPHISCHAISEQRDPDQ
jgi:hypothetical protein